MYRSLQIHSKPRCSQSPQSNDELTPITAPAQRSHSLPHNARVLPVNKRLSILQQTRMCDEETPWKPQKLSASSKSTSINSFLFKRQHLLQAAARLRRAQYVEIQLEPKFFRRKSCDCDNCGNVTKFQKYTQLIIQDKKIVAVEVVKPIHAPRASFRRHMMVITDHKQRSSEFKQTQIEKESSQDEQATPTSCQISSPLSTNCNMTKSTSNNSVILMGQRKQLLQDSSKFTKLQSNSSLFRMRTEGDSIEPNKSLQSEKNKNKAQTYFVQQNHTTKFSRYRMAAKLTSKLSPLSPMDI